ncbi:hypothetical protein Tco_0246365 [Tanacetum coccineum]
MNGVIMRGRDVVIVVASVLIVEGEHSDGLDDEDLMKEQSLEGLKLWRGIHHPCAQGLVSKRQITSLLHLNLCPLGAAVSVSFLFVLNQNVDEDFMDQLSLVVSSSGSEVAYQLVDLGGVYTTAFPLPTTSCSLEVVSDTGSMIIPFLSFLDEAFQTQLLGQIGDQGTSFYSASSCFVNKLGSRHFPFLIFCGYLRLEGLFIGGGAGLDCLTRVVVVGFLG